MTEPNHDLSDTSTISSGHLQNRLVTRRRSSSGHLPNRLGDIGWIGSDATARSGSNVSLRPEPNAHAVPRQYQAHPRRSLIMPRNEVSMLPEAECEHPQLQAHPRVHAGPLVQAASSLRAAQQVRARFRIPKEKAVKQRPKKAPKEQKDTVKSNLIAEESFKEELLEILNAYDKPKQTKHLQDKLQRQRRIEELEEEMPETLNAFTNGQKKSPTNRHPIDTKEMNKRPSCPEEELAIQEPESNTLTNLQRTREENSSREGQKSLPLAEDMEQLPNFVPEPVLMPFPSYYSRKHCKEIVLARTEPNLFVLVSAEEEKRFGLERVKEFRVSDSVLRSMLTSLVSLKPETLLQMQGLVTNEQHEILSSLNVSKFSDITELIRARTEPMLHKTFTKSRNHLESESNVLDCKNVFKHHHKELFDSSRTFDVFSLVFVKAHEKQVKDAIPNTRRSYAFANPFDYGSKEYMDQAWSKMKESKESEARTHLFGVWNWKYLRKTTAIAKGCSTLKYYFANVYFCSILFFASTLFPFDVGDSDLRSNPFQAEGDDMIMQEQGAMKKYKYFREGTSRKGTIKVPFHIRDDLRRAEGTIHRLAIKEKPPDICQRTQGFRAVLKRTRKIKKREEDQRFKPPDLDHQKHQDVSSFIRIKEAPPDATFKPNLSSNRFRGIGDKNENVAMQHYMLQRSELSLSTKEEPPDSEDLSSNILVRTGIGVFMMQDEKPNPYFKMIFEVGEQVHVYLKRKQLPPERSSKLMPMVDGPIKATRRINANSYQLDFQGKYQVSSSFSVSNLVLSNAEKLDLRSNPFQVGEDDVILESTKDLECGNELEPVEQHGARKQLEPEDQHEPEDELVAADVLLKKLIKPPWLGEIAKPIGFNNGRVKKVQTVYQRLSASSVRPLDPPLYHSIYSNSSLNHHSSTSVPLDLHYSSFTLDHHSSTTSFTRTAPKTTISDPYSSRLLEQNPIRPSETVTRASLNSLYLRYSTVQLPP
ncbi:hypothetical protein ISN44_As08g031400 [Arabidopsis suecica]|uniref:Tf2-1-like SH3-like domain-containing protein n=1 Tax=Arabidopsis suecica TaxID=45249 RepID=A0A8T2BA36_ARASU|nr:hypothetical protein ISN44_As08g031400 [Arabidopsis suecica]